MVSTNALTPAERIEAMVTYAEWQAYEEERRSFLAERGRSIDGRSRPIQHGTRQGYLRKCRCEDCTKANNDWIREYRWRKGLNKPRTSGTFKHGTFYGYQKGCRCEECLAHILAYRAKRKESQNLA